MRDDPRPPAWIHKRDGRLVPFESDMISRSLFAASEEIGQPDAFLARELADGVVFFLANEQPDTTPTTAQVAELVVKVVRELGQPALAAAFAAGQGRKPAGAKPERRIESTSDEIAFSFSTSSLLRTVLHNCALKYGLNAVFSRDLAAVQNDGLLTILGVESPLELAACVGVPTVEGVSDARQLAAGVVALDGLEDVASVSARELGLALDAADLRAVINLNIADPPSWAGDLAPGPLFGPQPSSPEGRARRAEEILEAPWPRDRVRIAWHLGGRDVQGPGRRRLVRVVERTQRGEVTFVFDRPKRAVTLGDGLDRQHSAVLLKVVLHLPRLLEATRGGDADLFLHKLGSLARLALSAAVQKRDFLRRRRPELNRGFELERARLLVKPTGLDAVTRSVGGSEDFSKRVEQRLRQVLETDGEACRLMTCVEAATPEPFAAPFKTQVRAAGSGTAVVTVDPATEAEQFAEWLAWAWQRTDVARLAFHDPPSPDAADAKR